MAQAQREVESDAISNRQALRLFQQSMAENRELRKDIQAVVASAAASTSMFHAILATVSVSPNSHLSSLPIPTVFPSQQPPCLQPIVNPNAQPLARPPQATPDRDSIRTDIQASASPTDSATRSNPCVLSSATSPHCTSHSVIINNNHITYDRDLLLAPPHHDFSANPELIADYWEHLKIYVHPGQLEDIGLKYWNRYTRARSIGSGFENRIANGR